MADSYAIQPAAAASAQVLDNVQEKAKELMQNYINSKSQVVHAADECSGLYEFCKSEYNVFFCMVAYAYCQATPAQVQMVHVQEKTQESEQNDIKPEPLHVAHAADECTGLYEWCTGSGEYSVFFCLGAYAYCVVNPAQVQAVHVQERAQESVQNDIKAQLLESA